MLPGLVRGDGGYDYNAIEVVWNAHGIDQARRPDMLNGIVKLITVVHKAREK